MKRTAWYNSELVINVSRGLIGIMKADVWWLRDCMEVDSFTIVSLLDFCLDKWRPCNNCIKNLCSDLDSKRHFKYMHFNQGIWVRLYFACVLFSAFFLRCISFLQFFFTLEFWFRRSGNGAQKWEPHHWRGGCLGWRAGG